MYVTYGKWITLIINLLFNDEDGSINSYSYQSKIWNSSCSKVIKYVDEQFIFYQKIMKILLLVRYYKKIINLFCGCLA